MAKRLSDIPLPEDSYFQAIEVLFKRLQGVDHLLTDPQITSARLVTNLEKMVLRETQRAFMFFSLPQLAIDAVIVNRIFGELQDVALLGNGLILSVPIRNWPGAISIRCRFSKSPYYQREVLGYDRLLELGLQLYRDRNPQDVFHVQRPYDFQQENGAHDQGAPAFCAKG